jgi:hypothetical protein
VALWLALGFVGAIVLGCCDPLEIPKFSGKRSNELAMRALPASRPPSGS